MPPQLHLGEDWPVDQLLAIQKDCYPGAEQDVPCRYFRQTGYCLDAVRPALVRAEPPGEVPMVPQM